MVPERWLVLTVRRSGAAAGRDAGASPPASSSPGGEALPPSGAGDAGLPVEDAGLPAGPDGDDSGLLGEDAGLLAEALVALGGRAVTETAAGLTTHVPEPSDPVEFLAAARQTLAALTGTEAESLELEWAWQPHEEWVELWKAGLAPRRVTDRVTIAPSWDTPAAGEGETVVVIDPGLAFGTAEHATTRAAIRLLDRALVPGERVLDVGCGSGILAIVAARLGAGPVVAVEGDPLAVAAAEENVQANDAQDVEVVQAWATEGWLSDSGPVDGIVANVESGVLTPLLAGFRSALAPGGWLIVGGVLASERDAFVAAAEGEAFRLVDEDREEEWWSARFNSGGAGSPGAPSPAAPAPSPPGSS